MGLVSDRLEVVAVGVRLVRLGSFRLGVGLSSDRLGVGSDRILGSDRLGVASDRLGVGWG